MSSPITGISHCVVWVRDLDAAAASYRRLGFSLSQYYLHPKSVGTANFIDESMRSLKSDTCGA